MYDLNRIKETLNTVCGKAGITLTVPVVINGRLTRTLGRVISECDIDDTWYPTKIEFSKQYIETATDDCIYQTILHECAHYIAVIRSHETHGHDAYFKAVCAEIGCVEDKPKASHIDRIIEIKSKYDVKCENCGETWHYSRAGKIVQHPEYYHCITCGLELGKLTVVKNW